jgi:hypothetical protein
MMHLHTRPDGLPHDETDDRTDTAFSCSKSQAEEDFRMESEMVITGAIVDSWVEPSGATDSPSRLVLQVAPKGRPRDLVIVEAKPSLVPDGGWLEDLGENMCHGSPVLAIGRRMLNGFLSASCLQLAR